MLRYAFGLGFQSLTKLPLATFLSNILACLVLALCLKFFPKNSSQYAFAVIGFCGGLSTFSTFSFETIQLIQNGQTLWAVLNVLVSVLTGGLVIFLLINDLKIN